MKINLHLALGCLAISLLAAGCGKPQELALQHLAPDAPAASGLPPAPIGDAPTPLLDRPPFGLYAAYPSRDTLTALSTGLLSPDRRYRTVLTEQGLWITRVDGAWLWQVPLPEVAVPKTAGPIQPAVGQPVLPPQPGMVQPGANAAQPAKPATTARAAKYVGPVDWTPGSTILLHDDAGTWVEIDPEACKVTMLPAALQGKEWITYSPDRKQVFYYAPGKTGKQLFLAKADGSDPKFQGENVTGAWGPDGKLVVTKVQAAAPPTPGRPERPEQQQQPGLHGQ